MNRQLLELLCEPVTGATLELRELKERDGEIWSGSLRSAMTGREYPIRSGIPRFVESDGPNESFGLQWNRFSQVQLDSSNGASYSRQRFEKEVGWPESHVRGQWVLDAGCGCGRFAEIAAQRGAKVLAFDYSSAVEAAARNLSRYDNVHYIQGDILHPPIRAGSLQFAYSIGVFQHTPDPEAALASVLCLLVPDGQFAFTIYGRRWYTRFYSKYLLRPMTRRVPPAVLLRGIEACMPLLFPLTGALFSLPGLGKVAQFAIPVANYVEKNHFTREQRYQEAILDTFDMLSPSYNSPMTPDQVRCVFRERGITAFEFRSTVPVNVTGTVSGTARACD